MCKTVVCAWGGHSHPLIRDRIDTVLAMIKNPMCLGTNADGTPKHPLYLSADTSLVPYVRKK